MPYKVIVVGTDGSERAMIAVKEALCLGQAVGATVHAVHMVHPSVSEGFSDSVSTQIEVSAMRDHAASAKEQVLAEAERQGVAVEMHNPGGHDAADVLLNLAQAVHADLIVVGNRGMGGVARFVLGSVPNKVAHRSPCSLLIVDTSAAA